MSAVDMQAVVRVENTAQVVPVRLTPHALERWHERGRPGVAAAIAADEPVRLLEAHSHLAATPS